MSGARKHWITVHIGDHRHVSEPMILTESDVGKMKGLLEDIYSSDMHTFFIPTRNGNTYFPVAKIESIHLEADTEESPSGDEAQRT